MKKLKCIIFGHAKIATSQIVESGNDFLQGWKCVRCEARGVLITPKQAIAEAEKFADRLMNEMLDNQALTIHKAYDPITKKTA